MNAIVPEHALIAYSISPEAEKVRRALIAAGLETPMVPTGLDAEEKYDRLR